jgi:hypothetical protein
MRLAAVAVVATGLLLAVVTLLALESGEVSVLRTTRADGSVRETRVWVAHHRGALWIEAATPEREWYRDTLGDPSATVSIDGHARTYRAEAIPGAEGHARIRSLLREKYGLRDWWVGLLQDTSRSIAVRLVPWPDDRLREQPD